MHRRILRNISGVAAGGAALALLAPQLGLTSAVKCQEEKKKAAPAGVFQTTPIKCEDGTTVVPWATPSREEELSKLQKEEFDVLVIGGGCVGTGTAWEASTRGLKVALVERDDFAAGTSGRSTKLIHGGIRYLEQAFKELSYEHYALVKEALAERAHLLHAAPFMAHPLPLIIPLYHYWELPYMWAGAKMYDLIAGSNKAVPGSYVIGRSEALYHFPMLNPEGLKGAVVYYDGMHNDTRTNVLLALTACQQGATVANYLSVDSITHDPSTGASTGAVVTDRMTGKSFTIKAKGVINATGPFGDSIRKMDKPDAQPLILGASGVHLILPDHFSPDNMGLVVPKTKDGRVLFFLPWEGMTICGTTDAPADITMTPAATEKEMHFILEESNKYLNRKITPSDVKAAWSGIRPLVKDPSLPAVSAGGKASSQVSRKHVVEVSPTGMVSILGGKWTTYRKMAEDAVDAYAGAKKLSIPPSKTWNMQLLGADRAGIVVNQKYDRITVTLRESYGYDKDIARHLSRNYGTRALQVAEIAAQRDPEGKQGLAKRISHRYPLINAEVLFAVEQEYACTAVDVLARRTRLAFLDAAAAEEAVPAVVELMAPALRWNKERKAEEVKKTKEWLKTMHVTTQKAAEEAKAILSK